VAINVVRVTFGLLKGLSDEILGGVKSGINR
jgi:hypothetical protein